MTEPQIGDTVLLRSFDTQVPAMLLAPQQNGSWLLRVFGRAPHLDDWFTTDQGDGPGQWQPREVAGCDDCDRGIVFNGHDRPLCGWWDGPSDHVYGVCNRSAGHKGRHLEFGPSGEIWAAWGGGNSPPAPPTRGGGSIPPWLRVETPAKDRRPHSRACGIRTHAHGPACSRDCPTCGGRAE